MIDIFVSYSTHDRQRVKQLTDVISKSGFSIWADYQILAGEHWANKIEQQLHNSRCVIVIWSRSSTSSEWVREEAAYARETKKLIPVLIDNIDLPIGFNTLQSISLVNWNGESNHPELQRLLNAISYFVNSN